MSYVHLPDPHPGRCLNHRVDSGDPYRVKSLRCLRREGHGEACRFPEPSKPIEQVGGWTTSQSLKPEPWVEPV